MNHFDLLIKLYPPEFRVRFGKEMREVFQAKLVEPNASLAKEAIGLVAGALQIQSRRIPSQASSAMTLGAAMSLLLHVALY